jgi:hypothetical protein
MLPPVMLPSPTGPNPTETEECLHADHRRHRRNSPRSKAEISERPDDDALIGRLLGFQQRRELAVRRQRILLAAAIGLPLLALAAFSLSWTWLEPLLRRH